MTSLVSIQEKYIKRYENYYFSFCSFLFSILCVSIQKYLLQRYVLPQKTVSFYPLLIYKYETTQEQALFALNILIFVSPTVFLLHRYELSKNLYYHIGILSHRAPISYYLSIYKKYFFNISSIVSILNGFSNVSYVVIN